MLRASALPNGSRKFRGVSRASPRPLRRRLAAPPPCRCGVLIAAARRESIVRKAARAWGVADAGGGLRADAVRWLLL